MTFFTPPTTIHRPMGFDFGEWTLWLRPHKTNAVPRWLGRAAQALFYGELSKVNGDLATYIHDMSRLKPFTVSNLLGAKKRDDLQMLSPNRPVRLRVTSMHPHMTALIEKGILPALRQNGLSLHRQKFRVIGVDYGVGRANFKTVEQLTDFMPLSDNITIRFVSPTSFKRTGDGDGFYDPFPHPELVFGSLFQKWRDATPYRLSKDLNQSIPEMIDLKSATIDEETLYFARGKKGVVPCFTGTATYTIRESDELLRGQLHLLAKFATYSGVGVQATVGLGQARAIIR